LHSDFTVYKAKYVVPVSSEPIVNGAIVVKGDRIVDVGFADDLEKKYEGGRVRVFDDAAIMPGLVNCHSHLELTAFRGSVDHYDSNFGRWLLEITKLRRDRDSDSDIHLSALLGAAEFAESGVTAVGDIGRVGHAGLTALNEVGLRGIVFQETEFSPSKATAKDDFDLLRKKFEELAERFEGIVRPGMSPHSPFTVSRALFEKIAGYSIDNRIDLSIHASESEAEMRLMLDGSGPLAEFFERDSVDWDVPNRTTVDYFNEIGVLDAAPLLAHCIRVSEEEIGFLAKSGARVAHCSKSNAKFGHGVAPLRRFLDKKVGVGIGTDSMASNNICDMFEEGRFAGLISRALNSDETFVSAREIVELITIGGAEALGISDIAGSLETGKQADFIVISVNGLGQSPIHDIYSTIAFSTSASSVTRTVVAGNTVFADGDMVNVDSDQIIRLASNRFKHTS
jgi:5-methylthioadenosine/S-adenosylhomocysteine deaminase